MSKRDRQSAIVIVVDDDEQLRDVFGRLLRISYPQTFAVARAEDAERMVGDMGDEERAGTLILMDVSLHPGDAYPDGCAAGRAIARQWPVVRLLFVSGHDQRALLARCPGHPPYLMKPMAGDALTGTVRAMLHAPPWKPPPDPPPEPEFHRRKGDR